MKRTQLILLLVCMIAAMLLTGCGAKEAPATAPVTTAAPTTEATEAPETTEAPTTEATEPPVMFNVGGKEYVAEYMGIEDISSWLPHYQTREFWHLVDAYEDLKDYPKTGDGLPASNYPAEIAQGEAYVIDYTWADGSVQRQYYLGDGDTFEDMVRTEEHFVPFRDKIQIGDKEYGATCYGIEWVEEWLDGYVFRCFWLVDDAYEAVKDYPKTGNVLPIEAYPMEVAPQGQVTVLDHRTAEGTLERRFYRTDGEIWNNLEITEEFKVN